jgi:CheY-like chemotaxis protein
MASENGLEPILDEPIWQSYERPGVLVVDDEHLVRLMVQLGLERHGFNVWSAVNGPQALHLYKMYQKRIAVVLLDVRMPGMDGPATLDALRKLNPDVVACFMSGNTGIYAAEGLIQRGAARVIAKPFRLDELAAMLRPLVQQAAAASGRCGAETRQSTP